ncbi:MAG: hypothetical protein K6A05_06955 [Lachnospiraceae bacterium]|nr:hypothetical protein [Lachnospiraceae bacterium]
MTESSEQARGTREQALKKRQQRRQQAMRRRRRILITSLVLIAVAIVLVVVMLLRTVLGGSFAEETALTLAADGSVTFEEVVDFDKDTYSKSEMKEFVKNMVDSYDGAGEVTLDAVAVRKDKAYVTVTYDSLDTYVEFTGYPAYSGTIASAKDAGHSFDLTFNAVDGGSLGDIVSASEVTSDDSRKVLILQENVVVHVPGKLDYVTTNGIAVRDSSTVEISPVGDNADAAVEAYIIYE